MITALFMVIPSVGAQNITALTLGDVLRATHMYEGTSSYTVGGLTLVPPFCLGLLFDYANVVRRNDYVREGIAMDEAHPLFTQRERSKSKKKSSLTKQLHNLTRIVENFTEREVGVKILPRVISGLRFLGLDGNKVLEERRAEAASAVRSHAAYFYK